MKTIRNGVLALTIISAAAVFVAAPPALSKGGRAGDTGVVYVTSQGLYYDTFGAADPLPPHGPFQKLEMDENGAYTEFGPGQPGYLGGRWWVDVNGDGQQDAGDHYFLCPLLGPGREQP